MEKIKVGIAGTGYTVGMADAHVRGYLNNPHCQLVALHDIVPGRAAQWAQEKNLAVKDCQTFDELLDAVDAVSIVTPNYAHPSMVVRALERGKHVLCEKPLSVDAESGLVAVNAAKASPLVSMIGFSYRGIPAMRQLKELIDQGRLGRIFTYRQTLGGCRIANPQVKLEWRMQKDLSGTGALADFGCHMVDLCDWLLAKSQGPMVSANGFVSRAIPQREGIWDGIPAPVTNDDSAAFNIQLESGALASFVASRLGVARHTLEVYGEGGMALFRDDKPGELELWLKDSKGGYQGKAEVVRAPESFQCEPWFNAEINEFIDAIRTGKRPERSLSRALYIQTVIDTLAKACETGETVALPRA